MKFYESQKGQTLIETMVAIFILVMGITAALGLAIYSFNATSLVNKQIIAMGLAREGVEAVKNMRDTNWLQSLSYDSGCNCYTNWQTSYFNISALPSGAYTLDFNPSSASYWNLDSTNTNYRLLYDSTAASGRFYYPAPIGLGASSSNSDYYRRIKILAQTSSPYSAQSPRLEVTSDVWWVDKHCPTAATYETSTTACRIRLQTYLTNWKNY